MVGAVRANQLRDLTLQTYVQAAEHALTKGIIIADTKFEFGVDEHDNLVLADEIFTPDSSRYWAVDTYQEGVVQPSFDKQFVRNWLLEPGVGLGPRRRRAAARAATHHRGCHTGALYQCIRAHFGSAVRRLDRLGGVNEA